MAATVLAVAAGAVAATRSASTSAPHQAEAATPEPRQDVATAEADRLASAMPPGAVSVAAQNLTAGFRYGYRDSTPVHTGSVIKLDILETALLRAQDAGRPLSDTETAQATAMIENSDNDAATALWNDVGGADGVRAANGRLGAVDTNPDQRGYWGLTTTNADDQLALLRALVAPGPLVPAARSFALGLMRQVQIDQRWGVGSVADPDTPTALKDGWLNLDDDNELWAVGSVGILSVHGQQVLMAVLTQHNTSQPDGIELVESLAHAITPAVTS